MVFIYFIDPKDEEFKDIMKSDRGSWKFRCQQQCLEKLHCAEVAGKPAAQLEDTRQKHACTVEADESMRIGMEGTLHRYHEDQIAGKRYEFIKSLKFSAQIYFHASSNENTRYKGSRGKIIGKTRENTGMAAGESQTQK